MLETLQNLGLGFSVALAPHVLWYGFIGCLVGTLVGVLPGVGPLAGISLLLPATYGLDATSALVMLAGIYYGAMYGGSTTSILMRIPGEAASVMTCIDGYAMARKGRAGPALTIAAVGSYVAGTVSVVALMFLAPPLAAFALRFGPPEYFSLLLLGLLVLAYMDSGSMLKGLAMAALGLLLGMIGIDQMSGYFRFAYGIAELGDGIGVVPVAVGLFGLAEILLTAGLQNPPEVIRPRFRDLLPSRQEWRDANMPIWRGTVIGFLIGIIPGSAHVISTFVSYAVERKVSKHPEEFGRGAVAGVAGPESANNAATSGAFVPMLALGVPGVPIAALLLAAMMVHGVTPGPLLIHQDPKLFWGFIASMYVGNVILLILNLPLVGLFVNLLRVPYPFMYPIILVCSILGVYAVNSSVVDVWIMLGTGVLGYVLRKLDFETAPIVLGLVLAPMMELALRQSLAMSAGSYAIFVTRPISVTLLVVGVVLVILALRPLISRTLDWRSRCLPRARGRRRVGKASGGGKGPPRGTRRAATGYGTRMGPRVPRVCLRRRPEDTVPRGGPLPPSGAARRGIVLSLHGEEPVLATLAGMSPRRGVGSGVLPVEPCHLGAAEGKPPALVAPYECYRRSRLSVFHGEGPRLRPAPSRAGTFADVEGG